jgi:hypothetical protein
LIFAVGAGVEGGNVGTWFQDCDRFEDPAGARRMGEFVSALSRFPVGHLVDLGAGHGIFSRIASDLGWRVTAVDVRDMRFPDDTRVAWTVNDVRNFNDYPEAAVVACLGLWYHLTLADQLALLARVAPRPLILDTHLARVDLVDHPVHRGKLGAVTRDGRYEGRLYGESGSPTQPTASWGNPTSFWPTAASLQRQLADAGYDVMEHLAPAVAPDREFVVAQAMSRSARADLDAVVARYNPIRHDPPDVVVSLPGDQIAPNPPRGAGRLLVNAARRLRPGR